MIVDAWTGLSALLCPFGYRRPCADIGRKEQREANNLHFRLNGSAILPKWCMAAAGVVHWTAMQRIIQGCSCP